MSEKSYIYEKARLKKIKEQKRVAKILHPFFFSSKKQIEQDTEESIERLKEEFGGTNVSWRYGTKIGKGGLSGEKRMRGNFHTTKFSNNRKGRR
tara:strand:- start:860 stop:1141 length:282 start_codon:yes stop_codon:yes gene_type:complete